MVEGTEF